MTTTTIAAKTVATITVVVERSRIVADNGAETVYVVDGENRFACHTQADIAALAPLYARGNSANGRVLGEAFAALTRIGLKQRELAKAEAAMQRRVLDTCAVAIAL